MVDFHYIIIPQFLQGFCVADEQRYALTTARIDFVEHEILTFGWEVLCSQQERYLPRATAGVYSW